MIAKVLSYLGLMVLSNICFWKLEINFKYEDYKDSLTLISGISGMIFTIMGIWIAFLYPNAVSRITNPEKLITKDFTESKTDSRRLESIVGAVMISAIIATLALVITLAKTIIYTTSIYQEYRVIIKSSALSILVTITAIQLEAIFYVIISNIMFINDLHFKRKTRESDESF